MSNYKQIWSTPIGEYMATPELHNEFIQWLETFPGQGPMGNTFNLLAGADNTFTQWVDTCCKEWLSNFYDGEPDIYVKRAWITIQKYGQPNETHSHGDTDIVSVYYCHSNPEIHPNLTVYDPRPPHIFNEVKVKNKDGLVIADCARHVSIEATTGKLFFMPGYLLHGVDINISQEERRSLAMNIKIKRGCE